MHFCQLSIAALSIVAATPVLARPGVDVMLKGNSLAIGDPSITAVAKRSGSPRAIQDANGRSKRAFNPQPDPPGKGTIQDANDRRRKVLPFKSKNVKQSNPIGTKQRRKRRS